MKENSFTFGLIVWSGIAQSLRRQLEQSHPNTLSSMMEFDSIVEHFAERIFNHAFRFLGNREDAEEATSDVFLRIHQGLGEFRGESQLSTWIWRITTNVCLTRKAKKKVQTTFLDTDELWGELPDDKGGLNPEESILAREKGEELARSIAKLPGQEAAAITLFYLDGMKYEEIAVILELPPGTVATALHRGREHLRKTLSAERMRL